MRGEVCARRRQLPGWIGLIRAALLKAAIRAQPSHAICHMAWERAHMKFPTRIKAGVETIRQNMVLAINPRVLARRRVCAGR